MRSAMPCIGVLIWMDFDVNFGAFARAVVERVKSSRASLKIVCACPLQARTPWLATGSRHRGLFAGSRFYDSAAGPAAVPAGGEFTF